ncbi:MAG TPA: DEAD/DEAH box helicase [Burkholderiaceae bacterium]|nr:DEAD/DEAH box helicase [Burkholderiaceae bacterium]
MGASEGTGVLDLFHPATRAWFASAFAAPTAAQLEAWPAIKAGRHALVAAPTGSGKTLAAFLAAIDALVRDGIEQELPDETRVVYVSPLKALSNDIQRNLEAPLAGIRAELERLGLPDVHIRTLVRTGDTPQSEREAMRRRPPHIVVTTPESLYILLTSRSGRRMLATTRTVIVDEIHALAPNKRGAHLALSLERLEALAGREPVRIGLSATQKPIEQVARFLVGDRTDASGSPACAIVDTGHVRARDLAIELPSSPLESVMSGEVWQQVYDRLAELVQEHRTTLILVNTRRLAERAARHLSERIGEAAVTAHHGSLAREQRLEAERRLKRGELRALVATASLELGIDIGEVDLVCQLGSTRSIAALLQRVGRSGHAVSGIPKGRLFPLSRDELCECAALLEAVRRGELDRLALPTKPLDVLAQQIVAEVASQEWNEQALFARFRRAAPFRQLAREEFAEVVRMLSEGFHTRRGRRSAHLHRDAVNGALRGRRGAALAAVTSGGTIPDTADYTVLLEPQAQVIGTVNEDFAVESLAGDVFQLGNHSYRIMRIERGTVRVEDARGQPPTMPFWLGEAPGRTAELSQAVSDLRETIAARLSAAGRAQALGWLTGVVGLGTAAAEQIVDYLAAANAALGTLPTVDTIVLERFFDESGGMQLVVHSPFGSRINRAWGLALRKRFCRKFDFELQAAATEDAIVLSLATAHSFPLADVARYLSAGTVRPLLVQALLAAPMFGTRWRWNASVALALLRFQGGRKVAPQLQRMAAEDLMATIFPDQVACGENVVGDREIPDHPLVRQTIDDCLHEAMDIDGLERVLDAIEHGAIQVVARDLTEPSPLALEILAARPYAYLDDAPLEERRTQAVMARRWIDAETAADLGKLDAEAIRRVREEVWPEARSADELHDALLSLAFLTDPEVDAQPSWRSLVDELAAARRATRLGPASSRVVVAAERLPEFEAVFPSAELAPAIEPPAEALKPWTRDDALVEILRDRLQALGPVDAGELAASLGLPESDIDAALVQLEAEGSVMRGRFTPDSPSADRIEWCERRLLARIHRYTVNRLRREIEPVEARDFLRFLFEWQRVAPEARVEGADAVANVVAQLEGFEAPAAAWEVEILPARVNEYDPAWLDELSRSGRVVWTRIAPLHASGERAPSPVRTTPIALASRRHLATWAALARDGAGAPLTARAQRVVDFISAHGASFFDEIVEGTGLLRTQVEDALGELVAQGLVNADSFGGLRALLVPSERRRSLDNRGLDRSRRLRRTALFGIEDAGRWALARRKRQANAAAPPEGADDPEVVEHVARTLLRRYGVVFWRLVAREPDWLPPWRNLLRCYRRLEARGEIRGGRFVAAVTGEQFAVPEAIGLLRDVRRREGTGALVSLSGADPLNLVGILTPGPRLPGLTGNRVLYRDGVPIALLVANEVRFLEALEPEAQWSARAALLRRQVPATLQFLA